MKDEEMAEEYAEKMVNHKMARHDIFVKEEAKKEIMEVFLAGLKAGRPKWHDLRKDPNDLPPVAKKVWIQQYEYKGEIEGDTWIYFKDFPKNTIAWCELTQIQFNLED